MVGIITANAATGRLQEITEEKLRDMGEAGAVQAAQERRELARDTAGYILRSHARIKATVWISDRVDLKVGASGGVFIALPQPCWRFAIDFHLADLHLDQLGLIEIDAQTGQVIPLSEEQLQRIREGLCAAKRHDDAADELITQHPDFLASIQEARRQKTKGKVRRLADLRQKYSEQ